MKKRQIFRKQFSQPNEFLSSTRVLCKYKSFQLTISFNFCSKKKKITNFLKIYKNFVWFKRFWCNSRVETALSTKRSIIWRCYEWRQVALYLWTLNAVVIGIFSYSKKIIELVLILIKRNFLTKKHKLLYKSLSLNPKTWKLWIIPTKQTIKKV